jgi:phosphoribosylformylglycinamidine cyclo-ligase
VRRDDLIDGTRCEPGDVIVGLPSSGLHTNGFTLVRQLVGDGDFDADLLLAPHRLYVREVRKLRSGADVKALAHITGGGILGNLPRVLPRGIGVEIDWESWERPAVYGWLTERGAPEEEQRRVFNLGVGMCAVVPARDAATGTVIGRLV